MFKISWIKIHNLCKVFIILLYGCIITSILTIHLKTKIIAGVNMSKSYPSKFVRSLTLFLLVLFPAGCSFSGSSAVTSNIKEESIKKPSKITAMFDIIVKSEDGQDKLVEEYKKQTGIDLVIMQPPHNQYDEKLRLAFSSNDIPDLVEVGATDYVNLASQGAFISLDSYMNNSEPIKKINNMFIDSIRLKDGKVYGFPLSKGGGTVTYIRKDWLDNLGLKIPSTWDELYEIMEAFTFKDPDQNGKNDTFGYTAAGLGPGSEAYLRDFLQRGSMDFTKKDGKWVDAFTQPEMKEAILRLKKAYNDKVLDTEFFTNQTSNMREKFYNGKAGIFNYWSGTWANTIYDTTKQTCGQKAEVVAIPSIKDSYYFNRISPIHAITSKAENPEGIYKWFIEYIHDGGSGQMLFTHGVQGVHYRKDGSNYKALPFKENSKVLFDTSYINAELNLTPWQDPIEQNSRVTESIDINMQNVVQMTLLPQSPTYSRYTLELNKLKSDIIARIMTGDISLDTGMALYKEKSTSLELDKILSEFNSN